MKGLSLEVFHIGPAPAVGPKRLNAWRWDDTPLDKVGRYQVERGITFKIGPLAVAIGVRR